MIGIYSLTSPSGKVYIGQSWDIKKRCIFYTNSTRCRQQPGLSRSIAKYGYNAHIVSIIAELPSGVSQKTLDDYEKFFIIQYKEAGIKLLNMKDGGMGGKLCQESIIKIQEKRKLQPPPTLGKKFTKESKERMSAAQKGHTLSEEAVAKARATNKGRIWTADQLKKLRDAKASNNIWVGKKHKSESRKKQSIAKIGNKINNKKVKRIDTQDVFDSVTDAAASIGVSMKTLSARIRTGCKREPKFTYNV